MDILERVADFVLPLRLILATRPGEDHFVSGAHVRRRDAVDLLVVLLARLAIELELVEAVNRRIAGGLAAAGVDVQSGEGIEVVVLGLLGGMRLVAVLFPARLAADMAWVHVHHQPGPGAGRGNVKEVVPVVAADLIRMSVGVLDPLDIRAHLQVLLAGRHQGRGVWRALQPEAESIVDVELPSLGLGGVLARKASGAVLVVRIEVRVERTLSDFKPHAISENGVVRVQADDGTAPFALVLAGIGVAGPVAWQFRAIEISPFHGLTLRSCFAVQVEKAAHQGKRDQYHADHGVSSSPHCSACPWRK